MMFPSPPSRFFCLFMLWAAVAGWGQATSGSIVVNVRDPQGALIPQASVEVASQETGLVDRIETDSTGSSK